MGTPATLRAPVLQTKKNSSHCRVFSSLERSRAHAVNQNSSSHCQFDSPCHCLSCLSCHIWISPAQVPPPLHFQNIHAVIIPQPRHTKRYQTNAAFPNVAKILTLLSLQGQTTYIEGLRNLLANIYIPGTGLKSRQSLQRQPSVFSRRNFSKKKKEVCCTLEFLVKRDSRLKRFET